MGDSSNQESFIAQTDILQDLIANRPLELTETMPSVEKRLRGYITEYSEKAFSELTSIGLDTETLRPILKGETVKLDVDEGSVITKHLLRVFGLSDKVHEILGRQGIEGELEKMQLKDMLYSLEFDVDVSVTGPIVAVEFKSPKAMDFFRFF